MEKTTVTFTHEDGRKIDCQVTANDDDTMEFKINLGEKGVHRDEKGLHITLFGIFMDILKRESEKED